jgi:hypothetical protein
MNSDAAGTASTDLARHIDSIEGAYDYMLAYAAQGVSGPDVGGAGSEIREQLTRACAAVRGLDTALAGAAGTGAAGEALRAFRVVVVQDAAHALAALELVRAQSSISSALVDNLNASIHLRALLTDLFLVDEALKG